MSVTRKPCNDCGEPSEKDTAPMGHAVPLCKRCWDGIAAHLEIDIGVG